MVEPDLHRRIDTRQQSNFFSDRLIVSAGTLQVGTPMSGAGQLRRGLKVVVVLSGRERIKIEGHPVFDMSGPQSCVILNEHESNKVHWVASDVPFRFALVQLDPSLAREELGIDLPMLLKRSGHSRKPLMHIHEEDPILQSLASQIVACPMNGPMQQMYLASKALELVASALNPMLRSLEDGDQRFSGADVQRVYAAYDCLRNELQNPPSLAELGLSVGLSTTKLTMGFRRVFGTTAFGVLQELRLQQAYRLLSSGQTTVSGAAYRVGYAPAHFATIFRRRFGVSPSKLR